MWCRLQVGDLDLVEELTALCNSHEGARRGVVVGVRASTGDLGQARSTGAPFDRRRSHQPEGSLIVDAHTIWEVRQGDDIDVVARRG